MNNLEFTKEVSKSNPFEVLSSIDNDVDLGTNGGILNLADEGTINVSSSNTPIGEKIDKIERQICEGKLRFMDDDGNPLVPTGIVEVVFDETANLRISMSGKEGSDKGYDTNSLTASKIEGKGKVIVKLTSGKDLELLIVFGVKHVDVSFSISSLELLDTTYRMEIVFLQNVDQSILYDVSADVDTAYSSMSGNGLDLF
ncbi:hypothetical protein Tco_0369077 [Tanacetum coccineum]